MSIFFLRSTLTTATLHILQLLILVPDELILRPQKFLNVKLADCLNICIINLA